LLFASGVNVSLSAQPAPQSAVPWLASQALHVQPEVSPSRLEPHGWKGFFRGPK